MTSNNISINGYPLISISELDIFQGVNRHPEACLKGLLPESSATMLKQNAAASGKVFIEATDHNGARHIIFRGVLDELKSNTANDVISINLKAYGNSVLCDEKREIRVFQDRKMTYSQLTKYLKNGGASYLVPQDGRSSIGSIFIQYNETDWEFAKRVASRLQTVVIVNNNLDTPYLSIGLPITGKSHSIDTAEGHAGNLLFNDTIKINSRRKRWRQS